MWSRRSRFLRIFLLMYTLIAFQSCGGSPASAPASNASYAEVRLPFEHLHSRGPFPIPDRRLIQHIVIIVQENRTPDNLFQDPVLVGRGADIRSVGVNSKGMAVPLTPVGLASKYDLSHAHGAFLEMYHEGNMDGADKIPVICASRAPDCPPPNAQFRYVRQSDVRPYFDMAEQYTFGDRTFQTNQGPSFPAHQFLLSGTSSPTENSKFFAAENPLTWAGCAAPLGSLVALVNFQGKERAAMYPCFEHRTLTDELDAHQISWRYYAPTPGSIWTAPNAIRHMCQPQEENGKLECTGATWNKVVIPQTGVLTDIKSGNLAAVSWVVPTGLASDHAGFNASQGPSWVASVVNEIGSSQYWKNTAIIITWDDWGGWYDHVPPPEVRKDCQDWGCGYIYGFRVPLIVISPYVKPSYISHVNHDFGSILKFIEKNFELASLHYADELADDLSDCFDFRQAPLPFQPIHAPFHAAYFMSDKAPPTDPDDD